jgi:hypothetical protein
VAGNFRRACALGVLMAALAFLHVLNILGPDLSPARAVTAAPATVMSPFGTPASGQAETSSRETDTSLRHGDDSERPHDLARRTPPGVPLPVVPAVQGPDSVRSAGNPAIALSGRVRPAGHPSGCRLALLQVLRC